MNLCSKQEGGKFIDMLRQSSINASIQLPSIAVGETIYSWCATVHRKACSMSATGISQALFGSPNAARLHDFPCFLDELQTRTGGLVGNSADLALKHSLLGYFLSFTPEDRGGALLKGVMQGSVSDIKMRLGIPASGVGGYHPLKCCSQCIERDVDELGWPIWHLSHQLPSVLVCREHQRPLVLHWDDVTPVHRREWIRPSAERSAQRIEIPIANDLTLQLLLQLADVSEQAAAVRPGTFLSEKLSQTYQRWAKSNSAQSSGGSIRHPVMVKALSNAFDPICNTLTSMGPAACKLQLGAIIGAVSRSKPKPVHPLKHLVLIACMFGNWDTFLSAYTDESQEGSGQEEVDPAFSRNVSDEDLAAQLAQLVREENFSIRQASAELGVSTSTGVRWAKIHGLDFTPRTRNLTVQYLDSVREQLRAGKEKMDVIAATSISSVSLNRLLSSEPALRQQWLSAKLERYRRENRIRFFSVLKEHPGVPVWLLRKLPNTGWAWLYRHDREWLIDIAPTLWHELADLH
jgi:Tn7-like transposition protein D/TniQ